MNEPKNAIAETNERRLSLWNNRVTEGNAVATLLIAVRPNDELHICIDRNLPLIIGRRLLAQALAEFEVAIKEKGTK